MGNEAMKVKTDGELKTIRIVPAVVFYPDYNTFQRMERNLTGHPETSIGGKDIVKKAGDLLGLAGRADNAISGIIAGDITGKAPYSLVRQKLAGVFSYYLDGIAGKK